MDYRFAGRVVDPDGHELVYLSRADGTPVAVKAGATLEGGYVVESVTADGVHLIYPPLGARVTVSAPPAPEPQAR